MYHINDEVGANTPVADVQAFPQSMISIPVASRAGDKFPVPVNIVDDGIFEPTEFFNVRLNPNPAQRLLTVPGQDVANVTILDNDGKLVASSYVFASTQLVIPCLLLYWLSSSHLWIR